MRILKENIQLHTSLNPKLFDQESSLRDDISQALLGIVKEFISGIKEQGIPINIVDIWLVGSNASYNYSNNSDIDVHIIVNNEDISCDKNLLNILYNYMKSDFNKNYNIKVKGLDVEVYIEDINTTSITNGIYSILHNEWVKFPEEITLPNNFNSDIENTNLYKIFYNQYLNLKDEDIEDYINRLYVLRKASLAKDGEFGEGNLVFKELRNQGILDELKERRRELKSKELTLEGLREEYLNKATP